MKPDDRVREHDDSWKVEQPKHPSENVLAAYLDGGLTARERSDTEAHLEACDACRAALADTVGVLDLGLAEADADTNEGGRPLRSVPQRPRRNRAAWLVAGAALAASIAGITLLRPSTSGSGDIESPARDARPGASDERIQELPTIAPRNEQTGVATHPAFTWARKEGADHYSFRLLGEDGATIWSRDVPDTTLVLPADVTLERGRSYFWQVDAMSAGIVASTRTRRFTMAP